MQLVMAKIPVGELHTSNEGFAIAKISVLLQLQHLTTTPGDQLALSSALVRVKASGNRWRFQVGQVEVQPPHTDEGRTKRSEAYKRVKLALKED